MELITPADIVRDVLSEENSLVKSFYTVMYKSYNPVVYSGKLEKKQVWGVYEAEGVQFGFKYAKDRYLMIPHIITKSMLLRPGMIRYQDILISGGAMVRLSTSVAQYLFCKENPDIFALLYKVRCGNWVHSNYANYDHIIIGEKIYNQWKTKREK